MLVVSGYHGIGETANNPHRSPTQQPEGQYQVIDQSLKSPNIVFATGKIVLGSIHIVI
jgi:hypothetical protein